MESMKDQSSSWNGEEGGFQGMSWNPIFALFFKPAKPFTSHLWLWIVSAMVSLCPQYLRAGERIHSGQPS